MSLNTFPWTESLTDALRKAHEAALAADPGALRDGGTSNFDDVFLSLPPRATEGMRDAVERCISTAGLKGCSLSTWRLMGKDGKGYFVATVRGQGARRTTMMEAFLKTAVENLPASCPVKFHAYYQMD